MTDPSVDVATGGDPVVAVASAAAVHVVPGEIAMAGVGHDTGCPCLDGQPLCACTCEIVQLFFRDAA